MVTFDFAKTPITQIADAIIIDSSRKGASDIHFDPRDNGLMVRIRIDGDLIDYAYIPKLYERNLTTRLKLMSNMNITESRLPQDGAIKGKFGGKDLDMRVSCLPTNEGEKIVIRILDYTRSLSGLDKLGFNKENYQKLLRMIGNPNGIILVTGATGSGKSTTVYSILQVLNKERTNIITVEDPIEMNIEGMNQVQVNSEIGLNFATVLRSILRQDPNVILIGEIRDSETAQIAVRASITGHLVLSTIHTNNSLSTIERLLDMDVEKYLLSSAITGIISQRLTKMLCPHCRIKRKTTEYEKKVFKLALRKDIEEIYDANKQGCKYCNKGYHGRIALQEVLEIDDEIKAAINSTVSNKDELRKLVYGTGNVITLLQDGLGKVLDGYTSFEEIYRVIEIDNDIDDSCMEIMNKAVIQNRTTELKESEVAEQKLMKDLESKSMTNIQKNTQSLVSNIVKDKNIKNDQVIVEKTYSKNFYPEPDVNNIKKKKSKKSDNTYSKNFYPEKDVNNLKKKKIDKTYSKDFYPEADINNIKKKKSKKSDNTYSKNFYPEKDVNNLKKKKTDKTYSKSFYPEPDINNIKKKINNNSNQNVQPMPQTPTPTSTPTQMEVKPLIPIIANQSQSQLQNNVPKTNNQTVANNNANNNIQTTGIIPEIQ